MRSPRNAAARVERLALFDGGLAAQPALASLVRLLDYVPHQPGRLVEVGVGPLGARGVRPDRLVERRELVRHEVARLGVHEREVAAVAGRDRRLAERHRFGDRQPEALAAVERDVAVAERGQRRQPVALEIAVGEHDVRPPRRRLAHARQVRRGARAVDALQVEQGAAGFGEGAREGLDQPERILALERAEEVEDEQEDERVLGQAEVGAAERGRRRHEHRQRKGQHRLCRLAPDRIADEVARHPHLVHVVECVPELLREPARFPEPEPSGVAVAQQVATRSRARTAPGARRSG